MCHARPPFSKLPLSLLFILIFSSTLNAQSARWPDRFYNKGRGQRYNEAPIQNGYVVLKSGDTLTGEIKIPPFDGPYCSILPRGKEISIKNIIDFYPKEIKAILVYNNFAYPETTAFESLNHNGKMWLWRLLSKRDSTAINDDVVQTSSDSVKGFKYQDPSKKGYYSMRMILISGNQRIKIFQWPRLEKASNLILKFINKRYGMNFSVDHFKTAQAMFEYILNMENNRGNVQFPTPSLDFNTGSRSYDNHSRRQIEYSPGYRRPFIRSNKNCRVGQFF